MTEGLGTSRRARLCATTISAMPIAEIAKQTAQSVKISWVMASNDRSSPDHAEHEEHRARAGQQQDDADHDQGDLAAGVAVRRGRREFGRAHAIASAFIAARILSIAPLR